MARVPTVTAPGEATSGALPVRKPRSLRRFAFPLFALFMLHRRRPRQ